MLETRYVYLSICKLDEGTVRPFDSNFSFPGSLEYPSIILLVQFGRTNANGRRILITYQVRFCLRSVPFMVRDPLVSMVLERGWAKRLGALLGAGI